jgi:hypothetical protein
MDRLAGVVLSGLLLSSMRSLRASPGGRTGPLRRPNRFKIGDGKGGASVVSHDSGYGVRTFGAYSALGYDWLRGAPGVSSALRARTLERLDQWLSWYGEQAFRTGGGIDLASRLPWLGQVVTHVGTIFPLTTAPFRVGAAPKTSSPVGAERYDRRRQTAQFADVFDAAVAAARGQVSTTGHDEHALQTPSGCP